MRLKDLTAKAAVKESPVNSFYLSLSDLMTLLCVFFAVLLGVSKIDVGQFERMKTAVTGNSKDTLVDLARKLSADTSQLKGVSVRLDDDGVRIDFESAALFDTGSAVLKQDTLQALQPVLAKVLQTKYTVDVEGHTDDVPLYQKQGEELETNWTLSGRRAGSVVNYLVSFGFSQSRLRIVGYASNRPRVSLSQKSGVELDRARSLNRRVSLLVK